MDPSSPVSTALTTIDEGLCRVCGGPLSPPIVGCPTCETPHHRDCWEYNRGCAIYGCGARIGETSVPVVVVRRVPARVDEPGVSPLARFGLEVRISHGLATLLLQGSGRDSRVLEPERFDEYARWFFALGTARILIRWRKALEELPGVPDRLRLH